MEKDNPEIITSNLFLAEKFFEINYFYILLDFILFLDIFFVLLFNKSILIIDFSSIFIEKNIKFFIIYLICFAFMISFVIPISKIEIYNSIHFILSKMPLNQNENMEKTKLDFTNVNILYREALLEQNQFKLMRIEQYYRDKKNIMKIANIVFSMVILTIFDLCIGFKNKESVCSQLLSLLMNMQNKIMKKFIIVLLCVSLYISIAFLITDYKKMFNNLIWYPKNKHRLK